MSARKIQVYYGDGRGKTSAALGCAIREAGRNGASVIIQFLKKKDDAEFHFISRLEPEVRLFRFQKSEKLYDELSEEEQAEEQMNMKNGINYARKVLQTGECSVLILDEILGLLDRDIISEEDLIRLLQVKSEGTRLILTGRVFPDSLLSYVDAAYQICVKKES